MRKRGFALSLGLPEDATSDCARVTLSGQSAALVEGQHGVIELTESCVRLRTGRGVLTVQGAGEDHRAVLCARRGARSAERDGHGGNRGNPPPRAHRKPEGQPPCAGCAGF